MRILVAGTAHYPALNGQAVFTENLAKALAKRGHNVLSVFPSETGYAYHAQWENVQIEALRSLNLNRLHSDAYFSLFSGPAIQRIFNKFQPEVVHVQDHFPLSRDVVQVARRNGIRIIGTNHFMPENLAPYIPVLPKFKSAYDWIMWHWMLGVYNRLDVATAQSQASASLLRSQGLRIPIFPVSCGIDLKRYYPNPHVDRLAVRTKYGLDPNRKIFLFVGRVDLEKRLDVLLKAMHQLNRDDIQLVIAGHGAAKDTLEIFAKELDLGEGVHFTGFIPNEDLPALLNSVDIFTMPSDAELLSIASLEAMACGRPVLLANAVALPELVDDGVNGYLFKAGDVTDVAMGITMLADQPERWAEMGAASLRKARFHGFENTMRQYETIYQAVLSYKESVAAFQI
jgi:1,2-diacylglycerol 3-alpha-glucosyltransferase